MLNVATPTRYYGRSTVAQASKHYTVVLFFSSALGSVTTIIVTNLYMILLLFLHVLFLPLDKHSYKILVYTSFLLGRALDFW
jgi:hypothetical protein